MSFIQFSSLSCVQLFVTPWTTACQASLSITNSWSLLKLMFIWVGDAIQPSHPLSSPSPPALSLSQHQGLFQWVGSSYQVAKVLEFQLQHQSFQWKEMTSTNQGERLQKKTIPLISLTQTFSFQNCEKINFLLLKPHSLWSFVMAALTD